MPAPQLLDLAPVSSGDHLDQPGVGSMGGVKAGAGVTLYASAVLEEPVDVMGDDEVADRAEQSQGLVASEPRHQLMEVAFHPRQLLRVVAAGILGPEGIGELPSDGGLIRVFHQPPRRRGFDQYSGPMDVLERGAFELQQQRRVASKGPGIGVAYLGAARGAAPHPDQPLRLEDPQCFPNARPGHLELVGQLSLREQLIARLNIAGHDPSP